MPRLPLLDLLLPVVEGNACGGCQNVTAVQRCAGFGMQYMRPHGGVVGARNREPSGMWDLRSFQMKRQFRGAGCSASKAHACLLPG